jgi:hypothetical protein
MFRQRILLVAAFALLPSVAAAQPSPIQAAAKQASVDGRARSVKDVRAAPPTASPREDSPWNGVILGAGFGALIGASVGSATVECSECAGFNVPLTFGVLGAGAGAAIGAGIDALRHSRTYAPVQAARPHRLGVSPILNKDVQAVAGWVRF